MDFQTLTNMTDADRGAYIAARGAAITARIKTLHETRFGCDRWESYKAPILVGNKRKPEMLDGFGCSEHNIWIES